MQNITAKEFEQMIKDTLVQEFSTDLKTASYEDIYKAAAFNVRKIMSARQKEFMAKANGQGAKQIYYLCSEFLMGRSLYTNILNLCAPFQAIPDDLADIIQQDHIVPPQGRPPHRNRYDVIHNLPYDIFSA